PREVIAARTVMWAAGVRASPVGEWLNTQTDRAGRVTVNPDFTVSGTPNIFVIGDAAAFRTAKGEILPGVAPVAKQSGAYVGRLIAARIAGRQPPRPFVYWDYGNLAA